MDQDHDKANPDSTEDRILKAALVEFAEFGLAGARIDRIARRAKINKAMIYYHFRSKETLYETAVERVFQNVSRNLTSLIPKQESIQGFLSDLASYYVRLLDETPEIRPIMLRELADPTGPIFEKIATVMSEANLSSLLIDKFSRGIENGRLRGIDPRQFAVSFLTANIGYYLMAPLINRVLKIDNADQFIEERQTAVVDIFMHGIAGEHS